jgi:hypothetical protein
MLGLVIVVLIVVALILLGAVAPKPIGWVVVGCGVLILLLQLFGGGNLRGAAPLHKDALRMADGR